MAKRDKLTQRQKRQVKQQQKQRLNNQLSHKKEQLDNLSSPLDGLLVSRYGEQADIIHLSDGNKYRCYLRQNLGNPITGDHVIFRLAADNKGIVEVIKERKSLLQRPSQHQGLKPVVANIDHIFVVIAPLPDFSSILLDRYLIAIQDAGIDATIIANKWELEDEIQRQHIKEQLSIYQKLGYPLIQLSTKANIGMENLKQAAHHKKSILVGQSGVGKSSIINLLFPEQASHVNTVSENSRLGQHTTTASSLFHFKHCEGFIIDSPGIREFGLWHLKNQSIAHGFIEFQQYIGGCKFRDCKHINEPGCNIVAATKTGHINKQRWENYCKILNSPSP